MIDQLYKDIPLQERELVISALRLEMGPAAKLFTPETHRSDREKVVNAWSAWRHIYMIELARNFVVSSDVLAFASRTKSG